MEDPSQPAREHSTASPLSAELRTFLIADVRGYTRFTTERGDEAGAKLAARFAEATREVVGAYDGQVIELRGDEALAVFSSTRQAVRAAITLQAHCARASIAEPEFPLPVGIGIDVGEAIPFEGGYRGGALNLAARLCSVAGPGEVLATQAVVHLARRVEGLVYSERGMADLKGFAEPVRVIEVMPEVDALSDDEAASLPWRTAATSAVPQRSPPIGNFLGAMPSGPAVAREEELEQIESVLGAVTDGSGQFLLLAGEAGVGKTRLAQEIVVQGRDRGFLVATGRCYEARQADGLYPFLEALAAIHASAPQSIRLRVGRLWPHVARLVPGALLTAPPVQGTDREEQIRVFQAITGFLGAIAESVPVSIVLDDLQWADDESLQLIQHLARHTRGDRILLAGAYRTPMTDHQIVLDRTLRDLSRERLIERITVHRLPPEGTAALVATTMGQTEASEEFTEFVHRRTRGNPQYIDEMLRSLGGRLKLVREIGAGGWGRVFEAVDGKNGKRVAAKLLFAHGETDLDALVRFQQEGAVVSTLKHPNIVEVYSTFLEEHASCIIMELLDGSSLAGIMRDEALSPVRIQTLMTQVTDALAYAHGRKIVHRDIKPDNIMVVGEDHVKVTDFGIARILRPDAPMSTMVSTGVALGTPLYMAPEQIEGARVDGRADIYSLGAVLYQLVTGRPPFEGDDPLAIAFKHVHEVPQSPRKVNAEIPKDWESLILKALAKNPADRFATAQQMGAAIASLNGAYTIASPRGDESDTVLTAPGTKQKAPVRERLRVMTPPEPAVPALPATHPLRVPGRLGPILHIGGISHRLLASVVTGMAVVLVAALLYSMATHSSSSAAVVAHPTLIFPGAAPPPLTFKGPDGVAADRNGNLFVADQLDSAVAEISPDGRLLRSWRRQGTGAGQFRGPAGIAIDRRGDVYVADTSNGRIQELPAGTSHWKVVRAHFVAPYGVAISRGGVIYVADAGDGVRILSPAGNPAGSLGAGKIQYAAGVALGTNGTIYVADSNAGRIEEFSSTGAEQKVLGKPGLLKAPSGLAVDGQNILVADPAADRVSELSPGGALLHSWTQGSGPRSFSSPSAIAVGPGGTIYVADAANHRVQQLSSTGQPRAAWKAVRGSRLKRPAAVTIDLKGNAWVVDSAGYLDEFSPRGAPLAHWGSRGPGSGPFTQPAGVAVDPHGNVYVADNVDNAIYELSPGGRPVHTWTGTATNEFNAPSGLASDAQGGIYVADSGSDVVWKITAKGRLLGPLGGPGDGPGLFSGPTDVAVGPTGALFVADATNNVIQEHTPGGRWIVWGGKGSGPDRFSNPTAIAVDKQGNIYVADTGNNRIQKLSRSGKALTVWGTKGAGRGQFRSPLGVAVDARGRIYVADTGNNRIQRFGPIR